MTTAPLTIVDQCFAEVESFNDLGLPEGDRPFDPRPVTNPGWQDA